MPRNSDFDYDGLKVEHVNDWSARDYHNHSLRAKAATDSVEEKPPGGFQPVKGMISNRQRRVHNPQTNPNHHEETSKAAMKDWKNRGINNKIEDY